MVDWHCMMVIPSRYFDIEYRKRPVRIGEKAQYRIIGRAEALKGP
ncbi:hypothetical protein SAMN04488056_101174 [Cohaesibacter marisflavi]|uniref:Uncharacterized protein n=1 Tax=Cohaesibacter marisflavi TaxID=655353 RepID=A0A1I4ZQK6_9HYPH|nr:hypothetical protein SAMN04488056_101174 [Cohaesibacter marisflavi]